MTQPSDSVDEPTEAWEKGALFYRQVHPSHLVDGMPTSMAFNPIPKDKDELSVDDAGRVSTSESWRFFTEVLGFRSTGTWAVSHEESLSANVAEPNETKVEKLRAVRKPITDSDDPFRNNPAHRVIDFGEISTKGRKKRRAQKLALHATNRGCLHPPQKGEGD